MSATPSALLDRLRGYTSRLNYWGSTSETANSGANSVDSAPVNSENTPSHDEVIEHAAGVEDIDAEELETLTDVVMKMGLTPAKFVTNLLQENGGQLTQQAFSDRTAWSNSTDSRLLQQLEDEDIIVRVQMGREKTVYLPDHAPTRESFPSADTDDTQMT